MIKNENFIVIQGFMRTQLNLKGNELLIYALIYGFSQAPDTYFVGTAKYISDWIGIDKRNVYPILKKLVEKGLLKRKERDVNGVLFVDYAAIIPDTINHHRGNDKSSDEGVTEHQIYSDETSQHNIEYNIKHNIEDNINITPNGVSSPAGDFDSAKQCDLYQNLPSTNKTNKKQEDIIDAKTLQQHYGISERVALDFLILRKNKKAPLTLTALNMLINQAKICNLPLQVVLEECIARNWQGFRAQWLLKEKSDIQKYASPHSVSSSDRMAEIAEYERQQARIVGSV